MSNATINPSYKAAPSTGVRPEDLLPNLHITVNGEKAKNCTTYGANVRTYTGSFAVSLSEAHHAVVELPAHRFFFQATDLVATTKGKKTFYTPTWSRVTGSIKLPIVTRPEQLLSSNGYPPIGSNPVRQGTIAEVSHSWIGKTTKYREPRDIYFKEGNYLYIAELCMYQGSEVLTISHNENVNTLLFKSNDLPQRYITLEQEYYKSEEKASTDDLKHKGMMVLKEAARITVLKKQARKRRNAKS